MSMGIRIRIRLEPPDDLAFHDRFEQAVAAASSGQHELDSPEAARIAGEYLRSNGYPAATIEFSRSVDEYLQHVSHWRVLRDRHHNEKRGVEHGSWIARNRQ
jgi:hypothetical protein